MKRLMFALGLAVVVAACGVDGPAAPTGSSAAPGGSTEAKVFPGQQNGGALLTATMTGPAEAPVPGDPDGTGTARITFNPGQEEICYVLEVSGIEPARAAHIHRAPAGEPGPIVVPLSPPTSGSSQACVTASRDLIRAILHDPEGYYVNVHNEPYPGGAVRGQLSK